MKKYRPTEQELIEHLDAYGSHADELAELLPHEAEPMEKLKNQSRSSSDLRILPLHQMTWMLDLTERPFSFRGLKWWEI